MKKGLNKQKNRFAIFAREYIKDFNGTRAAIAAGYSKKTAKSKANQLLTKVDLREQIQKALKKRNEKVELSAEWVVKELMAVAGTDLRRAYDKQGNLLPVHEMPDDVAKAIAGIEVDDLFEKYRGPNSKRIGTTTKIKRYDKTRALELLGRHLKMFTDKTEVTGKDGGPIITKVVNYADQKK